MNLKYSIIKPKNLYCPYINKKHRTVIDRLNPTFLSSSILSPGMKYNFICMDCGYKFDVRIQDFWEVPKKLSFWNKVSQFLENMW